MTGKGLRYALLAAAPLLLMAQRAPDPLLTYSRQGWSEPERNLWYSSTQGSRLMPLTWMTALERPQDGAPFLSDDNIRRYRYLPYTTPSNPETLPVGFARDNQPDRHLRFTRLRWLPDQDQTEPWVGFTCAACHTTEIQRGNRRLRIDGGPGMGDFQSFVEDADQALAATRADPARWDRFARRILTARDSERNRRRLGDAVDELIEYRRRIAGMNRTSIRYGFSRVDAFGYIFNQASLFTRANPPTANSPTAPVSYPFLWNVPQHNVVQWNGSVANTKVPIGGSNIDVGAIGRNAGEVIGVFGEVVTRRPPWLFASLAPFHSSVRVDNLIGLETMLGRLLPPEWPADLLGPYDRQSADRGERLYMQRCSSCHVPLDRTDLRTPIVAQMSLFARNAPPTDGRPNIPPGTDPLMACNAFESTAATGRLRGYKSSGRKLGRDEPVLNILGVTVVHSLAAKWREILGAAIEIYKGHEPQPRPDRDAPPLAEVPEPDEAARYPGLPERYRACVRRPWTGPSDSILGYKARPLTGIWATAPYLHNGSVPNLYELLLPPDQRSTSFWVGTRQFDPRRVGFETTPSNENSFLYRTRDDAAAVIWGNWNGGHDYGNARLSERDRMDLVEYMKTL